MWIKLFEDPILVVTLGMMAEILLLIVFINTRHRGVLGAMGAILVLVGVLLGTEWLVVTDRERIELCLDQGVDALERGDLETIFDLTAPTAALTRARARWALANFNFRHISLRNLQIELNPLTVPPTARASFRALFSFEDKARRIPRRYHEAGFEVEFARHGDRWLVTDHIEYHEYPGP